MTKKITATELGDRVNKHQRKMIDMRFTWARLYADPERRAEYERLKTERTKLVAPTLIKPGYRLQMDPSKPHRFRMIAASDF